MGHSDEDIKYDSHQINGLSLANIMSGRSQTPKVTLTILVTYVQSSSLERQNKRLPGTRNQKGKRLLNWQGVSSGGN